MNELIQYMKLHIISLEQDIEEHRKFLPNAGVRDEILLINGQIEGIEHILSVAHDILSTSNERE